MPDAAYLAFWQVFSVSLGIGAGVLVVGLSLTIVALLWLAIIGSARRRSLAVSKP